MYLKEIESDGSQQDKKVADQCWKEYKRRNNSIITNLFTFQIKYQCRCPDCNKISIKFEIFRSLLLDIPLSKIENLDLIFIQADQNEGNIRMDIPYIIGSTTALDIKKQMAEIFSKEVE